MVLKLFSLVEEEMPGTPDEELAVAFANGVERLFRGIDWLAGVVELAVTLTPLSDAEPDIPEGLAAELEVLLVPVGESMLPTELLPLAAVEALGIVPDAIEVEGNKEIEAEEICACEVVVALGNVLELAEPMGPELLGWKGAEADIALGPLVLGTLGVLAEGEVMLAKVKDDVTADDDGALAIEAEGCEWLALVLPAEEVMAVSEDKGAGNIVRDTVIVVGVDDGETGPEAPMALTLLSPDVVPAPDEDLGVEEMAEPRLAVPLAPGLELVLLWEELVMVGNVLDSWVVGDAELLPTEEKHALTLDIPDAGCEMTVPLLLDMDTGEETEVETLEVEADSGGALVVV
jgi:hypothetical protein